MVNVTKLLKDFRQADLQAYIDQQANSELGFGPLFPSKYTTKLTFESLQANFGAKVAADVVAFNSRGPRKGRPTVGKITGDIPKTEIVRVKDEVDINTYRQLMTSLASSKNPQIVKQVIDFMYEDSKFVLDGVNARMEWLAKQVASNGKYKLTVDNNAGGVQTAEIAFGIPNANRKNASVNWSNPSTAKPITDIKALEKEARAKGHMIKYATTDRDTIDNLLNAEETQKYCASYAANALGLQVAPTLEDLNRALAKNNLPQIRMWDSIITFEDKKGDHTSTTGWEAGNVTFSVTPALGEVQWTDTADSWVDIDNSVKAYKDFALVKTYAEQDPIGVITKGITYATPVLIGAGSTYILKTAV